MNDIISLKRPMHVQPTVNKDETLERLISMTNMTNLAALDKTIAAIKRSPASYAAAAARTGGYGERMVRAVHEVGMCLPPNQRAVKK